MKKKHKIALILLAGGKGTRFGKKLPKQFIFLDGLPIACHSLKLFLSMKCFDPIVIVCETRYRKCFQKFPQGNLQFALPGESRQDSLASGVSQIKREVDFVCIHDGARPFVEKKDVLNLLKEVFKNHHAAALGFFATDSVKLCNFENLFVEQSLPREKIVLVQTPQILPYKDLLKGLEITKSKNIKVTDDLSFMEIFSKKAKIVIGSSKNRKITFQEDLL